MVFKAVWPLSDDQATARPQATHMGPCALYGITTGGAAVKVQCAVVQSDHTYYADKCRYALCRLAEALTSLIGEQIICQYQ